MSRYYKRIEYILKQLNILSDNGIPYTVEVYERTNKPYSSMFIEASESNGHYSDWLDGELYGSSFEYHHWNFSTLDSNIEKYKNKAIHLRSQYIGADGECHIDTLFFFKKDGKIDIVTHDYHSGAYDHTTVSFPYKIGIKSFIAQYIKDYLEEAENIR